MNTGYTFGPSTRQICKNLFAELRALVGTGEAISALIRSVDEGNVFETERNLRQELNIARTASRAAESDEQS